METAQHVNECNISCKTENNNVFVCPTHGATVRCMTDHVKPVMRDSPNHIVFHIGTNDVLSNKTQKTTAKLIFRLCNIIKVDHV